MNFATSSSTSDKSADGWLTPGRFAMVLLVFIYVAYPDVISGQNAFSFRDFGYFGYPLAHYHRESFWRAEIPLWNPLSNMGLPFLAQWNSLVLYPGSLIYLLLPISWSLSAYCLAHLFLAGMGMYWLAWDWTRNRLAASVAGLAFALNGLSLNCLMWPNNIAALALMPLVILYVERAWHEGGRMILVGALFGAVQMLAGAPEIILFTWLILGLMAACQFIFNRTLRRAIFWRLPLLVLLVVGLTAAQMLPFFDLLAHSQRSEGFANADWAMPETGWANLLVPLFHTHQNRQGVFFQYGQYWTSSYYLGIGVVALALFALVRVHERRVWFLSGVTALSLILALGDDGHLYNWLRNAFPQFGFMRYPIKFVVLAVFCAPLLAASAIRRYQQLSLEESRAAGRVAIGLVACLLALSGGIIWFGHQYPLVEEQWSVTWRSGLSRAGFLAATLAVLYSLRFLRRKESQVLARLSLLLLVAFDLLTHAPRQNPTIPRAALEPGMLELKQLKPHPQHGESRAMITPEADMKLRYSNSSKPLTDYICSRLGLFSNCNLLEDIPKLNGFYSLYLREAGEVTSLIYTWTNGPLPALYDFLGVSQITRPGEYFEWTNRSSFMPLVTTGQKAGFADDPATLALLTETNFNPRATVYLPLEAKSQIAITKQTEAKIVRSNFSAHHAEIIVEAKQPSLVVIAQAFYHPWRAYVDGRPEKIWRANYGFQAIPVATGQHTVRLAYEDKQFRRGSVVSVAALLFCVLGLAISHIRGRSSKRNP
ncbi:MAG: hypothetical protein ABI651_04740 [Verrucomicrobiota bacterium]